MTTEDEFREKLEALHQFPCAYTFKLFGPPEERFAEDALAIVEKHLPGTVVQQNSRASSSAKHRCLTLEFEVPSADAVIKLYADFHAVDGLKMLL